MKIYINKNRVIFYESACKVKGSIGVFKGEGGYSVGIQGYRNDGTIEKIDKVLKNVKLQHSVDESALYCYEDAPFFKAGYFAMRGLLLAPTDKEKAIAIIQEVATSIGLKLADDKLNSLFIKSESEMEMKRSQKRKIESESEMEMKRSQKRKIKR